MNSNTSQKQAMQGAFAPIKAGAAVFVHAVLLRVWLAVALAEVLLM